jgi:hypothetical protein
LEGRALTVVFRESRAQLLDWVLDFMGTFATVWTADDWGPGQGAAEFHEVWAAGDTRKSAFRYDVFQPDQLPNLGLMEVTDRVVPADPRERGW